MIKIYESQKVDINDKEFRQKFFDWLQSSDLYSDKPSHRSFILPNGGFFSTPFLEPHYVTDESIIATLEKSGITVDIGSDDLLMDLMGCIRVNAVNEDYICLPYDRPNELQFDALEKWLDKFFFGGGKDTKHHGLVINGDDSLNVEGIKVTTLDGKQVLYKTNEYTSEDVIKRIKRYYASGNLYERLNRLVINYD